VVTYLVNYCGNVVFLYLLLCNNNETKTVNIRYCKNSRQFTAIYNVSSEVNTSTVHR